MDKFLVSGFSWTSYESDESAALKYRSVSINCSELFGLRKTITLNGDGAFKEKYKLPFTLLSDESKKMIKSYGVWKKKKFMGREFMGIVRSTFLIDKTGKIKKIWSPVSVKDHVKEVLENL